MLLLLGSSMLQHFILFNVCFFFPPFIFWKATQVHDTPPEARNSSAGSKLPHSSVLQHESDRTDVTTAHHGSVWITLNSFIWNIKTMKHKPSTKRQLRVASYCSSLKKKKRKKEKAIVKNGEDTQNRQWTVDVTLPFTRFESCPATGGGNREERKEKPGKAGEKKGKGDIRPTARSARGGGGGPGLKGLLWLVRTNKAVWERSGATERQALVAIIVKSWCLGTHIHTATNVHIQH